MRNNNVQETANIWHAEFLQFVNFETSADSLTHEGDLYSDIRLIKE